MTEEITTTTEETQNQDQSMVSAGIEVSEPEQFSVGDTVRVHYKIVEAGNTRVQPFEGIVIGKRGGGNSKTFTVRRIGANNVGVERIFPTMSPNIDHIEVLKRGKVRRAKLYYLRDKVGRAATKIKERKDSK